MKSNGKLLLCTVAELSHLLADGIVKDNVLEKRFSNCNFSVIDNQTKDGKLQELYSRVNNWYGIKAIETGFDTACLILVSDYYGGCCCSMCQLWDNMEDYVSMYKTIEDTILSTLNVDESAQEDSMLIVEMADD